MSIEHDDLSRRVDDLRAFESEYRLRLRLCLEEGLGWLDGGQDGLPLRAAARRLAGASDADLAEVLTELPEARRKRILTALLRTPVTEVTA